MPPKLSDKTPGEKLLALYTLLMMQGERPLSLGAMANALDCSKQTVLRLIAQLEASGYGKLDAPIRKGRENYYKLAKTGEEILDLGAKDLAELALCRNLLLHLLPDNIFPQGKNVEKQSPTSPVILYKGYMDYGPFEERYGKLLQAIQNRIVCKVSYRRSLFYEPREFYIAPMRIVSYHETLAILAWEVPSRGKAEPLYDNWLWLYLQRFVYVKFTRRFFDLKNPAMKTGPETEFGIIEGEVFKVRLLFEQATANYIHDRQWSADQRMEVTGDNRLILEMSARSRSEILSWVHSLGAKVTVLEPEWLIDEVRKAAAGITMLYPY